MKYLVRIAIYKFPWKYSVIRKAMQMTNMIYICHLRSERDRKEKYNKYLWTSYRDKGSSDLCYIMLTAWNHRGNNAHATYADYTQYYNQYKYTEYNHNRYPDITIYVNHIK